MSNNNKTCCPKFDPNLWRETEVTWKEKTFIKDYVPQVMHIPMPGSFGKAVGRMWKKIEKANAKPAEQDQLMLSHELTPWKSELYICVTKEVSGAENVKITGTFMIKVFDGPYSNVPKWIKEMDQYVEDKGKEVKQYYFYYTTCPKCAKKYGHNYVVIFAKI